MKVKSCLQKRTPSQFIWSLWLQFHKWRWKCFNCCSYNPVVISLVVTFELHLATWATRRVTNVEQAPLVHPEHLRSFSDVFFNINFCVSFDGISGGGGVVCHCIATYVFECPFGTFRLSFKTALQYIKQCLIDVKT